MGKLIELLNEYDPYIASDGEHKTNLWGYAYQGHSAVFPKELAESYIISARYGFIKWLVENDKIDRDKSKIITAKTEIVLGTNFTDGFVVTKRYWLYEQLLMILAIQDNPIDFLISILK